MAQVGQITIRVRPDTKQFGEELKSQLQKLERTLKVELPVEVDTDGVTEKIKATAKRASGEEIKLESELDTSGIVRQTRRVKNLAQKATGAIKLTAQLNVKQSIARIWAQMKIIQRSVRGYNIRFPVEWVGLARLLALATVASGAMLGLNKTIIAVGGALKALGGVALTLPAAFMAAGTGVAALIVGLRGFFSTLKSSGDVAAFEAALQNLAPSARASARALAQFREPLKEIQQATQQALFEGMARDFAKLGALLPAVRSGMVGVAGGIREMARSWITMATSQQSVKDLQTIMDGATTAFRNAAPAAGAFGQALRDIAAVGASFLPGMGQAVTNVAEKFRDFIANARETGKLAGWMRSGIDAFRKFGQVLSNIWGIFSNISNAMRGGEDLLELLVRVTAQAKELSGSAQGQAAWASLAAVMREVFSVGQEVFGELFRQIADVLKELQPFLVEFTRQLGGALVGALKILGPMLANVARWLSEHKAIMAPLLVAITGIVTAFKLLSTVANGINAIGTALTAMRAAAVMTHTAVVQTVTLLRSMATTALTAASNVVAAAGRMIAAMTMVVVRAVTTAAVWTAQMVRMAAVAIANWTRIAVAASINALRVAAVWIAQTARMVAVSVANWVRMAAAAVANAMRIAAIWTAQGAAMAASWIGSMVRIAAVTVANFVRMAAVALAQAARMAAAWFIAMGPIGWVIAAVIGLVALIIANWDKVKAFTIAAWNAIVNFIVRAVSNIKNAVVNGFNAVVGFMRSIPGRIRGALGNLGSLLYGAGRSIITGLINGVKSAVGGAVNAVKGAVSRIRSFFPFSPAKRGPFSGKGYTLHSGRALMEDWAKGVEDKAPAAMSTIKGLMETANTAASAEWHGTMSRDDFGVAGSVRDGVLAGFNGARLQIDGSGVAKLVNNVNQKNARR